MTLPIGYPIPGSVWTRADADGVWQVDFVGDTMNEAATPVTAFRADGTGTWSGTVAQFIERFRRYSE